MTTLTHCTCTSTDAWRTCTEPARIFVPQHVMIHAHLMAHVLSTFTPICMDIHGALSLIRFFLFFYLFLLSVPVFLFHLELFPELLNTKCMANNLRCSAAEESEDTLNVFHSLTEIADYDQVYYDSVTGASLPSKLCEAMQLEIKYMKEMNVYTSCEHRAVKEQGLTPIGTRWVFTNKGDTEHLFIRARLVAQETKRTTNVDLTDTSMTVAATPPVGDDG